MSLKKEEGKMSDSFPSGNLISKVHCGITWFIRLHCSVLDLLLCISLQTDTAEQG